ncbi:Lrp/AsnC family transcriptional regulator [Sphingomonas sp. RB1R13]|uniref:Lrp/AsnC family transcriptional regulator n=1 Tax=Sphingomonas sp. RB1R13 TaxID=3096159 RepID=UPI002FCA8DF6
MLFATSILAEYAKQELQMDEKDRQILRALQDDGRLSNQALSERVSLSPSPCLRRVRRLEECGIIQGYSAIVNQKACGLPVTAFLTVRLTRHSAEEVRDFEAQIERLEEVTDCYLMTGAADYLLRVIVRDLESYEAFIRQKVHQIAGVAALDTSFAYGTIKAGRTVNLSS